MMTKYLDLMGCLWCQETPALRRNLFDGHRFVFNEESVSKVVGELSMALWIEEKFKATGVFRCDERITDGRLPCHIVKNMGMPVEGHRLSEILGLWDE